MATITEIPNSPNPPRKRPSKSTSKTTNPFHFWFYFTVVVSLITLLFTALSYLTPQDPKAWFLSLPSNLRIHYSQGRTFKVQITPNHPQVEIFSIQEGPLNSSDHLLFVHGLGTSSFAFRNIIKILGQKGVHVVGIDLPGSGFSDKSMVVVEDVVSNDGVLGRAWEVFSEIREKGVFWGFDQLVEKGYVNFEEGREMNRVVKRESVKAIELGGEEMGRVLGQVVDAMGLAPVDLVLHDSALGLSANWISENSGLVRSVVILDSSPRGIALPLWVLEVPVMREVVLGSHFMFENVLGMSCMKSVDKSEPDAHRILLKGRNGRRAIVGMGKKLNSSFDLTEWSNLEGVKGLPKLVMWSAGWSKEWSDEGHRIADALPQATWATHSGGRWPQEHNSEEIAQRVYEFVSLLPKSTKQAEEQHIAEHIEKLLDEAKSSGHDDDHHDDHHRYHSHGVHEHRIHAHAGYMEAYGLGRDWAM